MKILLANPRGFCAGVDRAIDIVERAIELFGAPIYVRHEVVHNRFVVERLRSLGAVFVEELDEVPDGATVIFSAHGVSRAVQDEARAARAQGVRRDLSARDQGAHGGGALRARRPRRDPDRPRRAPGGRRHDGAVRHRASAATSTWSRTSDDVAQLEVRDPAQLGVRDADDALGRRHRDESSTRCASGFRRSRRRARKTSATRRRTARTRSSSSSRNCDVIVVVGSPTSSNSNRLREIAQKRSVPATSSMGRMISSANGSRANAWSA